MKKVLTLLLLLIVACSGSSDETLVGDSTTTSIIDTTTTTVQDTTTTIDRENCEQFEDIQSTSLSNIRYAFNDIKLNQFYKDYGINCIGKLNKKFFYNDLEFYEVYYSRSLYIVISQLLPLGILLLTTIKTVNKIFLFICLVTLLLYSQVIFSYNYSFNFLNNISFFSGLMVFIYFFSPKNEFNENRLIPKLKNIKKSC